MSNQSVPVLMPKSHARRETTDFASLYGFQPSHPNVFFLSPWEFCQWLKPISLQAPSCCNNLSRWKPSGQVKIQQGNRQVLRPLDDYVWDDDIVTGGKGFYIFPTPDQIFRGRRTPPSYERFSSLWCLQRRLYPIVP